MNDASAIFLDTTLGTVTTRGGAPACMSLKTSQAYRFKELKSLEEECPYEDMYHSNKFKRLRIHLYCSYDLIVYSPQKLWNWIKSCNGPMAPNLR